MTIIICIYCGTQQSQTSIYCSRCGNALPGYGTGMLPQNVLLQNRYSIIKKIGQGGFGAVYQATDQRLNKTWAIKEMSDAAISDPFEKAKAVKAFQEETQLLVQLNHPNIPRVTDSFAQNNKHYMVMEFVPGETLQHRLDSQLSPCSEQEVCQWADQLCDVLTYLHHQNPPVIFRDLKPENIMLTPQGRVKLIDFGIARFFKIGKPGDTVPMGTSGYAAPEQYGTDQTDARSDIYSLGVVLHQALTGYDPTLTPFALPPVRQLNSSVSLELEQIIATATNTDRLQRFQSVDQFRQALLQSVIPPTAQVGSGSSTGNQFGKVAGVAAAVIGVLVGIIFLGVQIFSRDKGGTSISLNTVTAIVAPTSSIEAESLVSTSVILPSPPVSITSQVADNTSTPTATPTSTPTSTPEPQGVVNIQELNLRQGTSTEFDIISKLYRGDQVQPIGRNQAGDWLQIRTASGDTGWAVGKYIDLNQPIAHLEVVAIPILPSCSIVVDSLITNIWDRSRLGCPIGQARIVWTAWQAFERGNMLWRQDTNQMTVFYDNGNTLVLYDQWDQITTLPSRGSVPAGRFAPIRGFGWAWSNRDDIYNGLGWGLGEERGVCMLLQPFEKGFAFQSSRVGFCNGNYNRANDPGFFPVNRAVSNDGWWWDD